MGNSPSSPRILISDENNFVIQLVQDPPKINESEAKELVYKIERLVDNSIIVPESRVKWNSKMTNFVIPLGNVKFILNENYLVSAFAVGVNNRKSEMSVFQFTYEIRNPLKPNPNEINKQAIIPRSPGLIASNNNKLIVKILYSQYNESPITKVFYKIINDTTKSIIVPETEVTWYPDMREYVVPIDKVQFDPNEFYTIIASSKNVYGNSSPSTGLTFKSKVENKLQPTPNQMQPTSATGEMNKRIMVNSPSIDVSMGDDFYIKINYPALLYGQTPIERVVYRLFSRTDGENIIPDTSVVWNSGMTEYKVPIDQNILVYGKNYLVSAVALNSTNDRSSVTNVIFDYKSPIAAAIGSSQTAITNSSGNRMVPISDTISKSMLYDSTGPQGLNDMESERILNAMANDPQQRFINRKPFFDPSVQYTFEKDVELKQSSLRFLNPTSKTALIFQQDNDDYAVLSFKDGTPKGSNININPVFGGGVRIGYNPQNSWPKVPTEPVDSNVPDARLAVKGDIYSSGRIRAGDNNYLSSVPDDDSQIYSLRVKKQIIDGDKPTLKIGDYMFVPTEQCLKVVNTKTNEEKCVLLQQ